MTASAPQLTGQTLVLGGAGFIGSNLVDALVAGGHRPRVLVRPSRSSANLREVMGGIDLLHGDFMDDAMLKVAMRGVNTVFHLITTTFPNMVIESSNYDLLSNLLPTIRMLEIAREAGVRRIVYASSGGTTRRAAASADSGVAPAGAQVGLWAEQVTIENYLSFYARTTPLEVSILRMSNPLAASKHLWRARPAGRCHGLRAEPAAAARLWYARRARLHLHR
ncbi:NAD-dependent epimerase/dehydratase family protein [Roseateles sp. GG27B]